MRIVFGALAVALLAGCGGGGSRLSKSEYEHHLRRDAKLAAKAATGASTGYGVSKEIYARRIALAQQDMRQAADDLDGISPPADAEKDTKTIAAGLGFIAKQLGRLHGAVVASNGAEAQKVVAAVGASREVRAVDAAVRDLQRKGYDVGVFGH